MDPAEAIADGYLKRHVVIDIGGAISRAWNLVRDHMAVLVGATVLGWLVSVGLAFVPILGWVVGFILMGGLDYMFLRRIRGEAVQVGDVFAGFNIALVNLAMAGVGKWVGTRPWLPLGLFSGIYLSVGCMVSLP